MPLRSHAQESLLIRLTGLLFTDEARSETLPLARHSHGRIVAVNARAQTLGIRVGESAAEAVRRIPSLSLESVVAEAGPDLARWAGAVAACLLPEHAVEVTSTSPDDAMICVTPAPAADAAARLEAKLWAAGLRTEPAVRTDLRRTARSPVTAPALTLASASADPRHWSGAVSRLALLAQLRSHDTLVRLELEGIDGSTRLTEPAAARHQALLASAARAAQGVRIRRIALRMQGTPETSPCDPLLEVLRKRLGEDNVFQLTTRREGSTAKTFPQTLPPPARRALPGKPCASHPLALFAPVRPIRLSRLSWEGELTVEETTEHGIVARNPAGVRMLLQRDGDAWTIIGRCA